MQCLPIAPQRALKRSRGSWWNAVMPHQRHCPVSLKIQGHANSVLKHGGCLLYDTSQKEESMHLWEHTVRLWFAHGPWRATA